MNKAVVKKSSWIVTLSLAGIAVVYMTGVWLPSRREIVEIRQQVQTKREFVSQSTGLAKILTASQKELETAEAANNKWLASAPRNRDLPALYGKINALAKDAGLVLTRFDPEPFNLHEELRELPVAIGCSGTFSQVYTFLSDIEALPATIWVEQLRLGKTKTGGGNVECELNMVVFSNNPYVSDCILHTK